MPPRNFRNFTLKLRNCAARGAPAANAISRYADILNVQSILFNGLLI